MVAWLKESLGGTGSVLRGGRGSFRHPERTLASRTKLTLAKLTCVKLGERIWIAISLILI